jgi:hypothetical protein
MSLFFHFNRIFNKLYKNIPRDINPSQPTSKVTYTGAFDFDFSMVLREMRSPTLLVMQDDAIETGGNMIVSGKMKLKKYQVEKKNTREYCGTYDPNNDSHEANMDKMSKLIRNLTNKMSIFEMENINSNKFPQWEA